jgi:hypothetical protein
MDWVWVLSSVWFLVNTDMGAALVLVLAIIVAVRLFAGAMVHRVQSSSMRQHDRKEGAYCLKKYAPKEW